MSEVVAHVKALWRYPVKSMAGEPLEAAELDWAGIPGDRRFAWVQSENPSGFPWLTIREISDLVRYVPRLLDPHRPELSRVEVTTPEGEAVALEDLRERLAERHGAPVHLLRSARGLFDAFPLSVLSLGTVRSLRDVTGVAIDARRFRPNVVVETVTGEPHEEDRWIGGTLRFGAGARVRLDERDERCVITNVDPDTAERDPRVLREIAQRRAACTGVYGSIEVPGPVAVGDPVTFSAGTSDGGSGAP
ncbi:MAG TPA: MOSC domain-containing protein [Solirubrobacteraceae bacterium]